MDPEAREPNASETGATACREVKRMWIVPLLGALLFIVGLVQTARAAIRRGRMSDPGPNPNDTAARTLEPRERGVGFLGVKPNWPGLLMMAVGALMLLLPTLM